MTTFEKIIIPLLDSKLCFGDVAGQSGFVDAYTSDPDRPFSDPTIYLMYEADKRNEHVKTRYIKLDSSYNVRYSYIKYIKGKPYLIYQFYINPEVKKLFNGNINLTPEQTKRIIDFWGDCSETAKYVCSNTIKTAHSEHAMPLEDYGDDIFGPPKASEGFTIQKRETTS